MFLTKAMLPTTQKPQHIVVGLRQTTRSEREPRRLFSNKCSCQIAQKCRCIFLHPKNKNFFAVFFNTKQIVAELPEVPQGYRDTLTPIFCVILFDYELIYFRKSSASKRVEEERADDGGSRRRGTAADGSRRQTQRRGSDPLRSPDKTLRRLRTDNWRVPLSDGRTGQSGWREAAGVAVRRRANLCLTEVYRVKLASGARLNWAKRLPPGCC